jgi:hypothetical protein
MNRFFAATLFAAFTALSAAQPTAETAAAAKVNTPTLATWPSLKKASWIWHSNAEPLCHFRKVFVLG